MPTRVLVVEADEAIARAVGNALREEGLEAHVAPGGDEARHTYASEWFSAVLISIHLPDISAEQLIAGLRHSDDEHRTPMLFFGAQPRDELEDLGREAYLQLPEDLPNLGRFVRACLRDPDVTDADLPALATLREAHQARRKAESNGPQKERRSRPRGSARRPKKSRALDLVRDGEGLRARGRTEEAIDAYLTAAELYEQAEKLDPALALYKLVLHLAPNRGDVSRHAGQAAIDAGRIADGLAIFRRSADALEREGRLEEALALLERMLESTPSDPDLVLRIARLQGQLETHRASAPPVLPAPPMSGDIEIVEPTPDPESAPAAEPAPTRPTAPAPGAWTNEIDAVLLEQRALTPPPEVTMAPPRVSEEGHFQGAGLEDLRASRDAAGKADVDAALDGLESLLGDHTQRQDLGEVQAQELPPLEPDFGREAAAAPAEPSPTPWRPPQARDDEQPLFHEVADLPTLPVATASLAVDPGDVTSALEPTSDAVAAAPVVQAPTTDDTLGGDLPGDLLGDFAETTPTDNGPIIPAAREPLAPREASVEEAIVAPEAAPPTPQPREASVEEAIVAPAEATIEVSELSEAEAHSTPSAVAQPEDGAPEQTIALPEAEAAPDPADLEPQAPAGLIEETSAEAPDATISVGEPDRMTEEAPDATISVDAPDPAAQAPDEADERAPEAPDATISVGEPPAEGLDATRAIDPAPSDPAEPEARFVEAQPTPEDLPAELEPDAPGAHATPTPLIDADEDAPPAAADLASHPRPAERPPALDAIAAAPEPPADPALSEPAPPDAIEDRAAVPLPEHTVETSQAAVDLPEPPPAPDPLPPPADEAPPSVPTGALRDAEDLARAPDVVPPPTGDTPAPPAELAPAPPDATIELGPEPQLPEDAPPAGATAETVWPATPTAELPPPVVDLFAGEGEPPVGAAEPETGANQSEPPAAELDEAPPPLPIEAPEPPVEVAEPPIEVAEVAEPTAEVADPVLPAPTKDVPPPRRSVPPPLPTDDFDFGPGSLLPASLLEPDPDAPPLDTHTIASSDLEFDDPLAPASEDDDDLLEALLDDEPEAPRGDRASVAPLAHLLEEAAAHAAQSHPSPSTLPVEPHDVLGEEFASQPAIEPTSPLPRRSSVAELMVGGATEVGAQPLRMPPPADVTQADGEEEPPLWGEVGSQRFEGPVTFDAPTESGRLEPHALTPTQGRLTSLHDALSLVGRALQQRATGILHLQESVDLVLSQGVPAARRGKGAVQSLIRLLRETGQELGHAGLELMLHADPERPVAVARALVGRGKMDAAECAIYLNRHLEDGIAALLDHRGGWWFEGGQDVVVDREELVPEPLGFDSVLADLVAARSPWDLVKGGLEPDRRFKRVAEPSTPLSERDRRFWRLVDGRLSLGDAGHLAGLTPERAAAFTASQVILQRLAALPPEARRAPEPAPWMPLLGSHTPGERYVPLSVPPATRRVRAASAVPHQALSGLDPARRIRALAELVRTSDYFTILGVDAQASKTAIDRAHQQLRAMITVPADADAELTRLSKEIVRSLDEARDVLKVPELKAAYLNHLRR